MGNYSRFIGIDAHKKYCFVNVQDERGNEVERVKVETNKENLIKFFSKFGKDSIATLESTYNWIFVYEIMKEYVGKIKLANPKQTKAISSAKIKTDKVDAKTLASLLRADLIPEIYVSNKEGRQQKDFLRFRYTLVRMRTALKNKVHAFMTRYGFEEPFSDMFGAGGTKYIKSLEWQKPVKTIVFKYLGLIEGFSKEIKAIDKVLEQTIKETEDMRLLKTIPGIGTITAYLIAAEIGSIERFFSYKKLVSYCGLVPGISASAGKVYFKKSKDRNKYLQWAFIEAAIPAIRQSPILLSKYTRIKKRKDSKKAKMTVARKLAEAAYKVLSKKQPYQEGITIQKISSL
jgi:transposase